MTLQKKLRSLGLQRTHIQQANIAHYRRSNVYKNKILNYHQVMQLPRLLPKELCNI